MKSERLTLYIKHLAVSGLARIAARIKSVCSLTGKCCEMPNVSDKQTSYIIEAEPILHGNI